MQGVPSLDLAREFRRRPFGRHSADLQEVLSQMRLAPIPGKHFLYMIQPHQRWMLARMSTTRPMRLELEPDVSFSDLGEAEWHVFRIRWQEMFGTRLDDDLK